MTIKELDKISKQYKDVDIKEFITSELDRVMSEILEKEHYETYRKLDKFILYIFVGLAILFISFFINHQTDIFLRTLIPLILLLSVISSFLLFWNIFRIPKRFKLLKEILHSSINEFLELHDTFYKKITLPYLKWRIKDSSATKKDFKNISFGIANFNNFIGLLFSLF